ncbi:sensor histidine kinase [Photobacterium phosphoreum]|uniref:sensor histidine kinase n=1 Tax=Photobacterium phosphoreum TaxID=659 RepID=UPI000D154C0F|nr:HAMP domain-containing sensor histidine kinase [Photobacterium phosphoreum]PSU62898.1 sensor histidine kinase [Photobacterium phosphoreum]PSW12898.1 sensor histidine kinase [Photobacterium phosphoreum]
MNILNVINNIRILPPEEQIKALSELKESLSEDEVTQIIQVASTINPPWFRNALLKAVNKIRTITPLNESEKLIKEKVIDDNAYNIEEIKSEAVAESIGQIIHELSPIIGSLELAASKELILYDSSKTKNEIERLQELIDMFSAWKRAELRPNYRLVNIYSIVSEEVQRLEEKNSELSFVKNIDHELTFSLDVSLVRTIISNALRNAVESSKQVIGRDIGPIVINSGCMDRSLWLSVIDDGIGLSQSEEVLFQSRYTTKVGNSGLGLSIVKKSISSMKGVWNLKNSLPNGAEFYFEIPKGDN